MVQRTGYIFCTMIIEDCLVENHTGNFLMARYADHGNKTGVKVNRSSFVGVTAYKQAEDWDFRINNKLALICVASTAFECEDCTFTDVEEIVLDVSKTLDSSPSDISKCKLHGHARRSASVF